MRKLVNSRTGDAVTGFLIKITDVFVQKKSK